MKKLGTIDLEILELAIKENGTFNENSLESSELKRLGVGKILDSLASLKDRNLVSLNKDGSFSITGIAKEILWSDNIPTWAKILRLLQTKSGTIDQICNTLRTSKEDTLKELEKLRKNQFVLMSPQRVKEKIIRIYEILPEGIEKIDKTEEKGFEDLESSESKSGIEITSIIDEITKEIKDSEMSQLKKDNILEKLFKIKNKLEI
ncbi:MAG: hypothetical protein QGH88_00120 [Nitrosopumilus sp.]|jgi:hypothetical protein|nr:hypothetical protein [Nitrosopumilus sp.]|tara:strand:- start:14487 stop:15101 length:615 start_codon:yes stop_codon:yes gene_type:complete